MSLDRPEETPTRPVSIRDVARRAGVSVTTVSHAVSGKRPVNEETAKRIRALIPAMGYVPYASAKNLQAGKTFMIGLVVPDVSIGFFAQLAAGVEEFADAHDYGVVLCASHSDSRREQRYFNMLRSRVFDGLIYNAAVATWDEQLPAIIAGHPVVLADEFITAAGDTPTVSADHREGGRLAGAHLASLGHRNVAVLTGPRGLRSVEDRIRGFQDSFPDARLLDGDFSVESGRRLIEEVIDTMPDCTAVFALNDEMAVGAIEHAHSRDLRVPEELSVIGFDDANFASWVTPALTTVRQPAREIGRVAASVLIDRLSSGTFASTAPEILAVHLIERGSTAPPRTTNDNKINKEVAHGTRAARG